MIHKFHFLYDSLMTASKNQIKHSRIFSSSVKSAFLFNSNKMQVILFIIPRFFLWNFLGRRWVYISYIHRSRCSTQYQFVRDQKPKDFITQLKRSFCSNWKRSKAGKCFMLTSLATTKHAFVVEHFCPVMRRLFRVNFKPKYAGRLELCPRYLHKSIDWFTAIQIGWDVTLSQHLTSVVCNCC